ncbi:MAG: hypothetical protein QOE44_2915, partial [Solirubrobacteraceae bacterium]|nr:hypothetical protein [Solirubrobacteraceae bacterium]
MPGTRIVAVGAAGIDPPSARRWRPRSTVDWRADSLAAYAVPLLGMLFACALVVSRSPDAVTHAQFWAEDGKIFYANVYRHGVLSTVFVPI